MPIYVFDTDAISLALDGAKPITSRNAAASPLELYSTVITVDENLSGWHTLVRRAKGPAQLERVYARLIDAVQLLGSFHLFNSTQACSARFDSLVRSKLNVKKNDLRIAAIVLEHGGIVVTRNLQDFTRVPNLVVEDWMQPYPGLHEFPARLDIAPRPRARFGIIP